MEQLRLLNSREIFSAHRSNLPRVDQDEEGQSLDKALSDKQTGDPPSSSGNTPLGQDSHVITSSLYLDMFQSFDVWDELGPMVDVPGLCGGEDTNTMPMRNLCTDPFLGLGSDGENEKAELFS